MKADHAKTWKKSKRDTHDTNSIKAKIINEINNTDITNVYYRMIVIIKDIRIQWYNNIKKSDEKTNMEKECTMQTRKD